MHDPKLGDFHQPVGKFTMNVVSQYNKFVVTGSSLKKSALRYSMPGDSSGTWGQWWSLLAWWSSFNSPFQILESQVSFLVLVCWGLAFPFFCRGWGGAPAYREIHVLPLYIPLTRIVIFLCLPLLRCFLSLSVIDKPFVFRAGLFKAWLREFWFHFCNFSKRFSVAIVWPFFWIWISSN